MSRILVVFYSRTGHTKKLAGEIAAALDADVEEIVETAASRVNGWTYLRSAWHALSGKATPIRPLYAQPANYDLVIIGSPVWAGNMAAPVRTFLEEYKADLPDIAFFCTMGGSGGEKVIDKMAALAARRPVARLVVTEGELASGHFREKVAVFAGRLRTEGLA